MFSTSTWLDAILEESLSFLKNADLHTVFVITILSTLFKLTLFRKRKWSGAYLAWVPFLLSFLLTPVMSYAELVKWGGWYLVQKIIYNGIAAELAFHLLLPYCQRKFPQIFTLIKDEVDKEGKTGGV